MIFNHISKSGIIAYARFFDSLLHQSSESKNFDNYKRFKEDAIRCYQHKGEGI